MVISEINAGYSLLQSRIHLQEAIGMTFLNVGIKTAIEKTNEGENGSAARVLEADPIPDASEGLRGRNASKLAGLMIATGATLGYVASHLIPKAVELSYQAAAVSSKYVSAVSDIVDIL